MRVWRGEGGMEVRVGWVEDRVKGILERESIITWPLPLTPLALCRT